MTEVPVERAKYRLLVAEDDIVNQRLATALLTKLGHDVTVVGDGKQAVERWHAELFDLIFMDLSMPKMGGFAATQLIRAGERAANRQPTPIVALTAHAMHGDEKMSLAAGMTAHVTKPIRLAQLKLIIERLVLPAAR